MRITSSSFADGAMIPSRYAFARPAARGHVELSENVSPQLAWSDVPAGTRSFAISCIDPDAPSVGDNVNQEGKTVPADLPRCDFVHWLMVDLPADCRELREGDCSQGVTAGGKTAPPGPAGAHQGLNDYTGWFAATEGMKGDYLGYDGPAPPWNDELVHHYHFKVYALNITRTGLGTGFDLASFRAAITGHVLAEATIIGRYTQNPARL